MKNLLPYELADLFSCEISCTSEYLVHVHAETASQHLGLSTHFQVSCSAAYPSGFPFIDKYVTASSTFREVSVEENSGSLVVVGSEESTYSLFQSTEDEQVSRQCRPLGELSV